MAGRSKARVVILGAVLTLVSGCATGQPAASAPSSGRGEGSFHCYLAGGCEQPPRTESDSAAPPSTNESHYSAAVIQGSSGRSASPAAGSSGTQETPIPAGPGTAPMQPTPLYLCPTGTLMIGVSQLTATPVGDQVKVDVTGSAINLSTEDVLVPVPTIDGRNASTTPTRQITTLTGAFDGSTGQSVVDLKPSQRRIMTFSSTISRAEFNTASYWGMQVNEADTKYTSSDSRTHSCAVRIDARPVVIFNTFGPVSFAWAPGN